LLPRNLPLFVRLPLLACIALLIAAPALAKTVVCITGDGDAFANSAEGYYRQTLPSPPAIIHVGGDSTALINCMAMAMTGDSLIIVAHGGPGRFSWGGRNYAGFTGGRAANGTGVITIGPTRIYPIPLPPNFTQQGLDVTVCMISCFSETAPSGAKSTVQSMKDGVKAGAMVKGFVNEARIPTPFFVLTGGTPAQRNAAYACLFNASPNPGPGVTAQGRVRMWLASFRPPGSGVTPNAQTVAADAITAANCPGAGGAVTVRVDYSRPPFPGAPLGFDRLAALDFDYDNEPVEDVSIAPCESEPIAVIGATWSSLKLLIH
jgi:hypothetical protein